VTTQIEATADIDAFIMFIMGLQRALGSSDTGSHGRHP
jgi:hypothetical protein